MTRDWMTEDDAATLLRSLVTAGRNGIPLAPIVMEAMRRSVDGPSEGVREARDEYDGCLNDVLCAGERVTQEQHIALDGALNALIAAVRAEHPAIPSEDTHPEDSCEDCHRSLAVVWFAPSPVWNAVMDPSDERERIICPVCFIKRADAMSVQNTGWRLTPENAAGAPSALDVTWFRSVAWKFIPNKARRARILAALDLTRATTPTETP